MDNELQNKKDEGIWNEFLDSLHTSRFEELKKEFGPDLKKPIPEDFGLDGNYLVEAQSADMENKEIENYNKKLLSKKNAYGIFFSVIKRLTSGSVPQEKKINLLGLKYSNYKKRLSEYPEEEILEIKEKERLLEIKRKKADYWFSLNGFQFEEEVANLFKKSGNFSEVVKTKGTGDGGIDLVLTHVDGTKVLVQCKAHKKEVGPHVVRDLYGTMQSEGIKDGVLISLGGVTPGVRDFIKDKNISIIDVNGIIKLQNMVSENQ